MNNLLVLFLTVLVSSCCGTKSPVNCTCSNQELNCNNLKLSALPNILCPGARTANLKGNNFDVLPEGLKSFESIILTDNRLTRLPSETLIRDVKHLEIKGNQIGHTSNEFRALSNLRKLWLESNNITDLQFLPENCNLYSVDVSRNYISSLEGPLSNCAELIFLGLSSNQISSIPPNFFTKLKKLQHVFLNKNKIISIPDGTFTHLSSLKVLFISMNKNISLSSGSFQGLGKLEHLELAYNEIRSLPPNVFSPTTSLQKLNLDMNKLAELPLNPFKGLNAIKEITMRNNKLTQLPVLKHCCGNLENIVLVANEISHPTEDAVRSLLRGKVHVKLGKHPVRKESVRWAVVATDIQKSVATSCSCGSLTKGNAILELCVDTPCGEKTPFVSWIDAATKSTRSFDKRV